MNNKIFSILLIVLLLLICFSSTTSGKTIYNKQNINNHTPAFQLIAETKLDICGLICNAYSDIVIGGKILPAGDYSARYRINFAELEEYENIRGGFCNVYCYVGDIIFFNEQYTFNYAGSNDPEDIEVVIPKYIPPSGFNQKVAYIEVNWYYAYYHNDILISEPQGYAKDDFTFYFSREKVNDIRGLESKWSLNVVKMQQNKISANILFLRFLDQFPMLERLLTFLCNN